MPKRPLISVALLYIAGIMLAWLPVSLVLLFASAGLLFLFFIVWPASRKIVLGLLLVLTGWINLAQRTAVLSPHDLRIIQADGEQLALVRARLDETPYHRAHVFKGEKVWSSMARLEVTAIRIEGRPWQPATGEIISSTREFLPDTFFAGQIVEVSGLLHPPRAPVAEGLFDYRAFLETQGIHQQLDVKRISDWRIISTPAAAPLADRFCAWGRQALALGLPDEDESLRLEWALTLGWKAALTEEVSEPFIQAATYHIFAVDDLRIAIIAGIFLTLLRVAGIPRTYALWWIAPFIIFYAAITGWPASAVRALIMLLIVLGGWALKKPSNLINSLFAAALIILLWEPRQLFQAGFQLSFFVVLCIILIQPFFNRLGEQALAPDPLLPEKLEPRWRKLLRFPARWTIDLFLASVAAWLGSIPLVAWYFHLLTPLSGPANVLAIPLCVLVLICNLAALFFAAWLPGITVLFNHAGWFFMEAIRATSHWSADWPGAYFYVPMPSLFTIALYYFILIGALTGWLFQGRRLGKISFATALILVWCALWFHERPTTRLTIIPLSGGHALYISASDEAEDWLVNCGSESAVTAIVQPFLRAHGVNRLDHFLLTHGEINYSGGAELILESFQPRNLHLSPVHFRSPSYRNFQSATQNHPALRPPIQAGDQCGFWQVLYPPAQSAFAKADESRLVLLGNLKSVRVLALADLGHAGQLSLLSSTHDLRADIVISGLPGDSEPLDDALLDAIRPRLIIIADASYPANKKAGAKLKARLARRNVPVFYTSLTDALTVSIRAIDWKIKGMDGTEFSYANSAPKP